MKQSKENRKKERKLNVQKPNIQIMHFIQNLLDHLYVCTAINK